MSASIIIPVWNGHAYLHACLGSLLAQQPAGCEVIVVDNGSTDGSADLVAASYPQVVLLRHASNRGFAAAVNKGLGIAQGSALVLLNQDTVVRPGALAALLEPLKDPAVGVVGCKLLYPDGRIQHAGAALAGPRGESIHIGQGEADRGQYDQTQDMDFVTGACLAFARSTFERVGQFDEAFAPAYFEDVDWCYRVREARLRVVYWPAAQIVHYESTSARHDLRQGKVIYHHGRLRLLFKHRSLAWLKEVFAPAEVAWAASLGRTIEMMAIREAYLRLALALPDIAAFRIRPGGPSAGQDLRVEQERLLRLALALRDTCVAEEMSADLRLQPEHAATEAAEGTPGFAEKVRRYLVQLKNIRGLYDQQNATQRLVQQMLSVLENQQRDLAQDVREINRLTAVLLSSQPDLDS